MDYHNISENYLILNKVNVDLRRDKDTLKKQCPAEGAKQSPEQDLSRIDIQKSVVFRKNKADRENCESHIHKLTQEVEHLVRNKTQMEEKQNMSEAIRHLIDSNAQREEQQQQLSEISLLLRDEILLLKEKNHQFSEMNSRYEGEVKEVPTVRICHKATPCFRSKTTTCKAP